MDKNQLPNLEIDLNTRKHFIYIFSSFSATVFLLFGLGYLVRGENIALGLFEFFSGMLFVINLYVLYRYDTIKASARIVVLFVMLISIAVFINGGLENTGNLWIMLVPMFPLLLLRYKEGSIWLLVYSVILILILLLNFLGFLALEFSSVELRQTLIVYTLFSILLYYNEKVKIMAKNSLKDSYEEIMKKDAIIIEQSRLAQMGEMLNMIAHQWRQPLNAISVSAMVLSVRNNLGELTTASIEEHSLFIDNETQNMSKTIQDLMEFNKPEKNVSFSLYEATAHVTKMISPQLKNKDITLEVDIDKEIRVFHNPKNIEHVLLNLIVNARDAFENKNSLKYTTVKKVENKKIKIFTTTDADSVSLTVEDNAGGIPEDILGKVFDLYFTTKDKANGTGIGLYMAKKMLEGINGCSVNIEVINDHTLFKMRFEIDESG